MSTALATRLATALQARLRGLGLQGKITLTLAAGALLIAGIIALPAFLFARDLLIDRSTALAAAQADRERQAIELRIASDLSVATSLAANTVTANALADSMGRDAYLVPLLRNQVLQVPGARLDLLDYRGQPVASSEARGAPAPSAAAVDALIAAGRPDAYLLEGTPAGGVRLVALLPVVYRLSDSVEGAVVLSIPLDRLVEAGDTGNTARIADAAGRLLAGRRPTEAALESGGRLSLPPPLDSLGLTYTNARDRAAALSGLSRMAAAVVLVGIILVVLVVVLARTAAAWLATPLRELAAATERAAATGRPQGLPERSANDEFGRLTQSFNQMVKRLRGMHEELEQRVEERTRALSSSEARLRYVMDATGEGLWDWDLRTNRVSHNARWLEMLGLGPEYEQHDSWAFVGMVHPDDRDDMLAALRASLAQGALFSHEYRLVRPDGRVLWVLGRGNAVERDVDGRATRMVGSLIDVTARREATEQLRVRELYLRATLDNLPFLFWLKDAQSRILTVNREYALTAGFDTPEALVGLSDFDFWPADLAEHYRADDLAVMTERRERALEELVETGGERRWIETYKRPVIAEDGTLLGTVGFARDITARKEMEQALEQSEQRWHLAVSGSNDGIWDWDISSGFAYFSPRWLGMLGYAPDEIAPTYEAWRELVHPDDLAATLEILERHMQEHTDCFQVEFRLRCKDGGYKWVLSRGRASFDERGRAVRMAGSHTDISARRAAEAAVRERTEQLDAIFSLSPDGFVSVDSQRRIRYLNPAFTRMTGLCDSDLLGVDEQAFSELLSAGTLPGTLLPAIGDLRADAAARAEGTSGPVLIALAGPPRAVLQVTLGLSQTETVSHILYFRDVTRETEVDQMKSEFLSTAAHELRTPMASILGFSELLITRDYDAATRLELLRTIHGQSEYMASILNELLDLARIEARRGKDFVLETLSLETLLGAALCAYSPPAGRAPPTLSVAAGDGETRVDRKKMVRVIANVLSNAYKYSPAGGEVTVAVQPRTERDGRRMTGFSVRDAGIGMTAAQVERVCERFYRADATGRIPGTGLGMSIVKEIVELHQGRVDIESAPGAGTTVYVWLPLAGQ